MTFDSIDELRRSGFIGFKTIKTLQDCRCSEIPSLRGVYLVVRISNSPPNFLLKSTGGHFKGKDPSVPTVELHKNWIENTNVLYIGKAGGQNSKATLKGRLMQYMQFGAGRSVGHWGGRYIWQLEDSSELLLCWRVLNEEEPCDIESELISTFVLEYGKRPFANLRN